MVLLEDILIVARTVAGEARNQSMVGMKAVAHVIINRKGKKLMDSDNTLAGTALRYKQFSCWNEDDPNREIVERFTMDDRTFRLCVRMAIEAIDEDDFTGGATHYHVKGATPKWAVGHTPCFTEGDHVFYNDIA